jgi:hypothetical protein
MDDFDQKILNCVINKINNNENYGYIITKNVGKSLDKIFYRSNTILSNNDNVRLFLKEFQNLLQFLKILYDQDILHLDIKSNNITKLNGNTAKMNFIDFGRLIKLKERDNFKYIIKTYLYQSHYMYSFEPKLINNLYNDIPNKKILLENFIQIVEQSFDEAFNNFISSNIHPVYNHIFHNLSEIKNNLKKTLDDYLSNALAMYVIDFNDFNKEQNTDRLINYIFYPIIKKYDMYCMGIVLYEIMIYNNQYYSNYKQNFKISLEKLIKSLLLNKINNVNDFTDQIEELKNLDIL